MEATGKLSELDRKIHMKKKTRQMIRYNPRQQGSQQVGGGVNLASFTPLEVSTPLSLSVPMTIHLFAAHTP
jgi:hypothetical protein